VGIFGTAAKLISSLLKIYLISYILLKFNVFQLFKSSSVNTSDGRRVKNLKVDLVIILRPIFGKVHGKYKVFTFLV
jgi:hypothetical protein